MNWAPKENLRLTVAFQMRRAARADGSTMFGPRCRSWPNGTTSSRKRADQAFTVDVLEGMLGWLGLNRVTRHQPPGKVAT
jgi:hypothetical protein